MNKRQPIPIRHEWAPGARISADPEAVAAQFTDLITPDGGLALEDVITASEAETAPLHEHFEWDDETAAHLHRLEQAGEAVRSLRRVTISTTTEEEMPAERVYVPRRIVARETDDEPSAYIYIPVALAQSDGEQMDRLRARAIDRIERLVKEFRSIRSLADLAGDLEDLLLKWR